MSTGADCYFVERKPREWYYYIEQWPYDETEEYDQFGPFSSFSAALKNLDHNHANPGGYSIEAHPDSDDDSWEEA